MRSVRQLRRRHFVDAIASPARSRCVPAPCVARATASAAMLCASPSRARIAAVTASAPMSRARSTSPTRTANSRPATSAHASARSLPLRRAISMISPIDTPEGSSAVQRSMNARACARCQLAGCDAVSAIARVSSSAVGSPCCPAARRRMPRRTSSARARSSSAPTSSSSRSMTSNSASIAPAWNAADRWSTRSSRSVSGESSTSARRVRGAHGEAERLLVGSRSHRAAACRARPLEGFAGHARLGGVVGEPGHLFETQFVCRE